MWRSIWRSFDRFSHQHFKHVISELQNISVVNASNRELVIDLMQAIVEVVTYGDKQDPMIFELFMEHQVLGEFVRLLKISKNSRIEAPLLQYLSIMIQNMESDQAIYYCLSNDYVNAIILHEYNFHFGDLASYFVSFLRAVSSKLNRDTLCLLVKVNVDTIVSFPLYTEALKFSQHGEKMIQTAVRALTLNIYNVSDNMIYDYITTPPASKYFSDLVQNFKKQCIRLDGFVCTLEESDTKVRRRELLQEADVIVDDLYYLKDIISVGEYRLSRTITHNLLHVLLFPILIHLLNPEEKKEISALSSLYLICRLVQVVGGKDIVNPVVEFVSQPDVSLSIQNGFEKSGNCSSNLDSSSSVKEDTFKSCPIVCPASDIISESRSNFIPSACYDDHRLLLAFVFLLFILTEQSGESSDEIRLFLVKNQKEILSALLNVLVKDPPVTVFTKWHVGWLLRNIILSHEGYFTDIISLQSFVISYDKSLKMVVNELNGMCFDHIIDTLRIEWISCKTALEKPLILKDPLFLLELPVYQRRCRIAGDEGYVNVGMQSMVDSVKDFVLHFYLKTLISEEVVPESILPEDNSSRTTHASDTSATFGSEISLGSGIPCRIAISNAGTRDIYMIPMPSIVPGKLVLAEKHPLRSNRGLVIAIAPLASLNPKIDKDHTTWLRLTIREFDVRPNGKQTRGQIPASSDRVPDGKWTLGFSSVRTCEDACSLLVEEIENHRDYVRTLLSPLLQQNNTDSLPQ